MQNFIEKYLKPLYLVIFYRVFYDKKAGGYFIRKRFLPFILLSPIIVPFFMLYGILMYIDWVTIYKSHWIRTEKQKLTPKQKLGIKLELY